MKREAEIRKIKSGPTTEKGLAIGASCTQSEAELISRHTHSILRLGSSLPYSYDPFLTPLKMKS